MFDKASSEVVSFDLFDLDRKFPKLTTRVGCSAEPELLGCSAEEEEGG